MRDYKDPVFEFAERLYQGPWFWQWNGLRGCVARGGIGLLLASGLAVLAYVLSMAVGAASSPKVDYWWGVPHASGWGHLKLSSLDLTITQSGDSFTASYILKVPMDSTAAHEALSGGTSGTGNDLVNNVLGAVSVAEFRYGFGGSPRYAWTYLNFADPEVTVSGKTATIEVDSYPLQVYLHQHYIAVAPASGVSVSGADQIHIKDSAVRVQVLNASGVHLTGVGNGQADLNREKDQAVVTVFTGNDLSQDWLAGLRGIGGTIIPVADDLFTRLGGLIFYLVLLWALVVLRRALPAARLITVACNAVSTVITALVSIAFLAFMVDLTSALFHDQNLSAEAAAGPLALLAAGIVLVWPVACFRVKRSDGITDWHPGSRRENAVAVAAHVAIVAGYWAAAYYGMRVNLVMSIPIVAVVLVLVAALTVCLLGTAGMTPRLVSAGTLAAVLGSTILWPLLPFNGWMPTWDPHQVHVNIIGKWVFLALVAATACGLCVLAYRVIQASALSARRRLWTAACAVLIGAALLPDAVSNSQVANSAADGLTLVDVFGFLNAVPELLDWLLLALAVGVAMSLPATTDARRLARCIAIPIGMLLLYWNATWLYLPVTGALGLALLAWLVLPRNLAGEPPHSQRPELAMKESIAAWRQADFADKQRQALTAGSTDALVRDDQPDYPTALASLAAAQADLAEKRDSWQKSARERRDWSFDHRGEQPDKRTAMVGALAGAILGIIPAIVMLLSSSPSLGGSGYPVLDFFGGTAWTLLEWTGYGWFIGYCLPLMRGKSGSQKAFWLFIASIAAPLPLEVIWNDSAGWAQTLVYSLELFAFLMIVAVYLSDIRPLRAAGMRAIDWISIQNWRFAVTWSTALVAAIGTAAAAYLTTAATDLSNRTFAPSSGSTSVSTPQSSPKHN